MTEAEAHQFIASWDRKVYPWRAKTETGMALRLESSFFGMMAGTSGVMITSMGEWLVEGCALLAFGILFWLYLRARKACRVLGYSLNAHSKS